MPDAEPSSSSSSDVVYLKTVRALKEKRSKKRLKKDKKDKKDKKSKKSSKKDKKDKKSKKRTSSGKVVKRLQDDGTLRIGDKIEIIDHFKNKTQTEVIDIDPVAVRLQTGYSLPWESTVFVLERWHQTAHVPIETPLSYRYSKIGQSRELIYDRPLGYTPPKKTDRDIAVEEERKRIKQFQEDYARLEEQANQKANESESDDSEDEYDEELQLLLIGVNSPELKERIKREYYAANMPKDKNQTTFVF